MFTPASRHRSTMRLAASPWVVPKPTAFSPAKVAAPKLSAGTIRPEAPSRRYSMARSLRLLGGLLLGCRNGLGNKDFDQMASGSTARRLAPILVTPVPEGAIYCPIR